MLSESCMEYQSESRTALRTEHVRPPLSTFIQSYETGLADRSSTVEATYQVLKSSPASWTSMRERSATDFSSWSRSSADSRFNCRLHTAYTEELGRESRGLRNTRRLLSIRRTHLSCITRRQFQSLASCDAIIRHSCWYLAGL